MGIAILSVQLKGLLDTQARHGAAKLVWDCACRPGFSVFWGLAPVSAAGRWVFGA